MKGRAVAPSKDSTRIAAMRAADVAQVRAWAAQYGVSLFGSDDLLLYSIHDARAVMLEATKDERQASRDWLATHDAPVA